MIRLIITRTSESFCQPIEIPSSDTDMSCSFFSFLLLQGLITQTLFFFLVRNEPDNHAHAHHGHPVCVCAWPTLIFWLNLTFLKFIFSGKLDFEVPTATGRWRLGWNHERSRQCRDGRVGGVRTFLDQLINFFYFTFIQNK
jgi:uncharacterized protein with PQ loop repeat